MEDLYKYFRESKGVSIDTRTISGGELFFCLKGERFNGNVYASKALELGAYYVVVDDPEYFVENVNMLLVEDSLKTLQALSFYHRSKMNCKLLGITGTNGKTTTKELIYAVLSTHFRCIATIGNLNNHIGVPLTLLRIKEDDQVAVIEMGANHINEIAELSELASPDYGIITNIGRAHLEGFGSFENIIEAKTALYRRIEQKKGLVFVNADDALLMEKVPKVELITYGQAKEAHIKVELIETESRLKFKWKAYEIQTQLFGDYNLSNAAAAIAVGYLFGMPENKIIQALENYVPSNNRSQFVKGENNDLVLDAYNANPDSMKQALGFFMKSDNQFKVVILGDMLELGDYEEREHKALLDRLVDSNIESLFLVGPAFAHFKEDYPKFKFYQNSDALAAYLLAHPIKDAVVLLKGSRGIGLEILKKQLL